MPARLTFGIHAQIRLRERGIDPAHIKRVVLDADRTAVSGDGTRRARKTLENGRVLEVIHVTHALMRTNDYFIVTAHFIH